MKDRKQEVVEKPLPTILGEMQDDIENCRTATQRANEAADKAEEALPSIVEAAREAAKIIAGEALQAAKTAEFKADVAQKAAEDLKNVVNRLGEMHNQLQKDVLQLTNATHEAMRLTSNVFLDKAPYLQKK